MLTAEALTCDHDSKKYLPLVQVEIDLGVTDEFDSILMNY